MRQFKTLFATLFLVLSLGCAKPATTTTAPPVVQKTPRTAPAGPPIKSISEARWDLVETTDPAPKYANLDSVSYRYSFTINFRGQVHRFGGVEGEELEETLVWSATTGQIAMRATDQNGVNGPTRIFNMALPGRELNLVEVSSGYSYRFFPMAQD